MNENCWLPALEYFENYDYDWSAYEAVLYSIFKGDFIDSHPLFRNDRVDVKCYPKEFDKEESFFHITCKDYAGTGDRNPDFRRCERIRWIRAFIENYNCDPANCEACSGVKVWSEPYKKGRVRIHILLEEERYLVVLEKRNGYYLLITAFYLDYDNALDKELKRYEQYR